MQKESLKMSKVVTNLILCSMTGIVVGDELLIKLSGELL
jgi:hypothetical protein